MSCSILVECKPDFTFIEVLGFSKKKITHSGNKSELCKKMGQGKNLIGLIDDDPGSYQPSYIQETESILKSHNLEIKSDKSRNNKLIILSPRLEDWIVKRAKTNKLEMDKFNLPSRGKDLHRVINERLTNFRELLVNLRQDESMKILKRYISC